MADAKNVCKAVAKELGLRRRQVFICSTGIIGVPLPVENIQEAIQAVGPFAVDIASGVESAPGVKDLLKVRQLIERVRPS